jgi:hypothetical protein
MIDDFEHIESLSETFHRQVVSNQKRLNEVRRKQFQSLTGDSSKINLKRIVVSRKIPQSDETSQDFQQREKSQMAMLVKEMNKRLISKIEIVEDNPFKMKELVQERALFKELEKRRSNKISNALKTLSAEYDAPLSPLLIHVDMLLQKQELSEKQKDHLKNIKQNILSCLDVQ